MPYQFDPMTQPDARAILAWRYDAPYTVYNADSEHALDYLSEFLDTRSPYFAVRDVAADGATEPGPPVGFFAFGSACEVGQEPSAPEEPHLYRSDGSLTIGLGLRPDATGQGRGQTFVEAGVTLARERYKPNLVRLFVYTWNHRATRVYERSGFTPVGIVTITRPQSVSEFLEMTRLP